VAHNLEIGAGDNPQPGYWHCDRHVSRINRHLLDFVCDALYLPFGDGELDNILLFGVVEHFGIYEVQEVFLEISRCLCRGGKVRFDVPNLDWFLEVYRTGKCPVSGNPLDPVRDEAWILKAIYGSQDGLGQFHRWGWNEKRMREFLMKPNWEFSKVELIGRQWRDPEPNHLIWECIK